MLFRFVKDHILNRDSDFIYKRFKTVDYDYRDLHNSNNYFEWDEDSLANMYQD